MNKKITSIIIDDNQASINVMKKLITEFFHELEVTQTFTSLASSIPFLEEFNPDIVFLDVEMPNENGFQLFEYFPKPRFRTIFITAYRDYATKAFRVQATDFLVKPINPSELKSAVEKVKNELINQNKESKLGPNKIAIASLTGFEFINIDDIFYCKALDNYTMVFTREGRKTVSKPLKNFEKNLEQAGFFRTSRSYLVNIKHIKSLILGKKPTIKLENDEVISLSKANKKRLMEILNQNQIINL